MNKELTKELTIDEWFVIQRIREAGKFATIKIEKMNDKLIFITCEKKERILVKK